MEENIQNEEMITIDLEQMLKVIRKNTRLIILTTIIVAVMALVFTIFLLPKEYASSSSIYLVPKVNTETGVVDYTTLTANSKQVNNYMVMIKGKNILKMVANKLSIKEVAEVQKAVSVSNTTDTEIIEVKATTDDPKKSQQIVKETIATFFEETKQNLKIENMTILNEAEVNNTPVSPSKKLNTIIGALIGLLGSVGYVVIKYMVDKRLRTKTEAENFLGLPVLAEIPYFED